MADGLDGILSFNGTGECRCSGGLASGKLMNWNGEDVYVVVFPL